MFLYKNNIVTYGTKEEEERKTLTWIAEKFSVFFQKRQEKVL